MDQPRRAPTHGNDSMHYPVENYMYGVNFSARIGEIRFNQMFDDDLAVVIEDLTSSADQEVYVKLVQGARVLELVPLRSLSRRAEAARRQDPELAFWKLPISATKICPRIGITYEGEDGQLRRFQVMMRHESDFDAIVRIFQDLRCNVRQGKDKDRPSSSATNPARPHNPPPSRDLAQSVARTRVRPASASAAASVSNGLPFTAGRVMTSNQLAEAWPTGPVSFERSNNPPFPQRSLSMQHTGAAELGVRPGVRPPSSKDQGFAGVSPPAPPVNSYALEPARPFSAPYPLPTESASQALPPKRPLPFVDTPQSAPKKSKSAGKTKAAPKTRSVRPSSAAAMQPTPPQSAEGIVEAQRPAKRIAGSSKAIFVSEDAAQPDNLAPIDHRPSGSNALSVLDPNAPAQHHQQGVPLNTADPEKVDDLQTTTTTITKRTVLSETEYIQNLRGYASAPTEGRQIVIDSMIAQLIDDDDFEILCTDVEHAWRRIGLETRST